MSPTLKREAAIPPDEGSGVAVRGLTKRFVPGGAPAVSEVSFVAREGAITTLLGPSGAGKSTALRFIAGLEEADRGSVHIGGVDVTRTAVRERQVGFVFQSYALFRHMTVRDNVAFGLDVRKTPRRQVDERVNELLAMVQLEGYAQRHPAQLSGGQRQRVALARALAPRPRVLLLDEPFGALDSRVRGELREQLMRLHDQVGLTTILVTHDQDEAFELSQEVVLMFGGRVVQTGTPRQVYDRPLTPEVAHFLGSPNRLAGKLSGGRAQVGGLDVAHSAADGTTVEAFVSSHDIRVSRPDDPADPTLGRIERLTWIGARVKVLLSLPGGERLNVDLSRGELGQLGEGDRVKVELGAAKVFVGGAGI